MIYKKNTKYMSFFILDDFISEKDCEALIKEATVIHEDDFVRTHNNTRLMLTSSNLTFKNLLTSSSKWIEILNKLNSKDFLQSIKEKLKFENNFHISNYFSDYEITDRNLVAFKALGLQQIKNVNTLSLIKYFFFRLYRSLKRRFKYFFINIFKNQPIELLFDYSKAKNEYKNEVHRDSYDRIIIFLLYLNKLDDETNGGSLNIFKNISKATSAYPQKKDYEFIKKIDPKPGRLVIMLNDGKFFHSVDKISNLNGTRDFIYGGYTILSGKNPFIKSNFFKMESRTGFHIYD